MLHACGILDTRPEPGFDGLTQIVATVCQAPIALVSLVDRDRQWFKSKVGLEADETSRDVSFCSHAIQFPQELFVVEDTYLDMRFKDNPLVTGGPGIRFYAGAPLVTPDGHALGSLCVIDRRPRSLCEDQAKVLQLAALQVVDQIERSRAGMMLAAAYEELDLEVARRMASEEELATRNVGLEDFAKIVSHDLRSPLQAIRALSNWTEEDIEQGDHTAAKEKILMVGARAKRLDTMLQDLFDYSRLGTSLKYARVELGALLRDIVEMEFAEVGVQFETDELPSLVTARAPLELIFRNLFGNAIKHHDGDCALISVRGTSDGESLQIDVSDDGPGIEAAFAERIFGMFHTLKPRDEVEGSGMGLTLVRRAASMIDATVELLETEGRGATFRVTLPLQAPRASLS